MNDSNLTEVFKKINFYQALIRVRIEATVIKDNLNSIGSELGKFLTIRVFISYI